MRILIVSQYFWPENFRINDIAVGLQEKGHQVTVLTGIPNYPEGKFYPGYSFFSKSKENWQGIDIIRARQLPRGNGHSFLLLLNYVSFVWFASLKACWLPKQFDKIFVFQLSPIFLAIPGIVAKKRLKIPLYHNVQDLWPESLASTNKGKHKWLLNWVGKISDYIYHQADFLWTPSRSFQNILIKRGLPENRMEYLPNSTESYYKPVEKEKQYAHLFTGQFHFVLAGNIGEAQGIEIILSAAANLKNKYPGLKWIIVGDGRMRSSLMEQVASLRLEDAVQFPGRFPATEIPALIAYADATLLTLKRDPLFAITVPSRLQTYMACGKPMLASIDGEAAEIIQEADCGLVSPANDEEAFIGIIEQFLQADSSKQTQWGINARNYYLSNFDRNYLLDKLHQKLSETIC
jgi:glycosyltransferase involved in cell wall biosynthesis